MHPSKYWISNTYLVRTGWHYIIRHLTLFIRNRWCVTRILERYHFQLNLHGRIKVPRSAVLRYDEKKTIKHLFTQKPAIAFSIVLLWHLVCGCGFVFRRVIDLDYYPFNEKQKKNILFITFSHSYRRGRFCCIIEFNNETTMEAYHRFQINSDKFLPESFKWNYRNIIVIFIWINLLDEKWNVSYFR